MKKSLKFTPRAQSKIYEIFDWTFENFGYQKALLYESQLIDKCNGILSGFAGSQKCSVLVERFQTQADDCNIGEDLQFVRTGEHFIFFEEMKDCISVIDIVHSQRNIPEILNELTTKFYPEYKPEQNPDTGQDQKNSNESNNLEENDNLPKPRF